MRGLVTVAVLAAFGASGAMAQTALTTAASLSPIGVQADGAVARQAEFRLLPNVGVRIESSGGLSHPGRAALLDPYGHRRRLASTFDFFPDAESGFHLSIGMRSRPKAGKLTAMTVLSPATRSLLGAPGSTGALRMNDGYKRKSPMALVGWTEMLDTRSSLRFDAGALAMRARSSRPAYALADAGGWRGRSSGIGATMQVSFLRKF